MRADEIPELETAAFCYWLQGAIEIGEMTNFTAEHAAKVFCALKRIKHHTVFTLQSLILIQTLPPEVAFFHINNELQQIFIHVIDTVYEGNQEFFSDVHQGKVEVL